MGRGRGRGPPIMTQTDTINPTSATSQTDGSLTVPDLRAPVTIRRDAFGVAHVRAENEHDAWFGQGFASAQDRLWQMEYDRRRATGRWAEVAGDRKSTRLNSSHANISYAVFCLKKKTANEK